MSLLLSSSISDLNSVRPFQKCLLRLISSSLAETPSLLLYCQAGITDVLSLCLFFRKNFIRTIRCIHHSTTCRFLVRRK
jgi:hypothetical protein